MTPPEKPEPLIPAIKPRTPTGEVLGIGWDGGAAVLIYTCGYFELLAK